VPSECKAPTGATITFDNAHVVSYLTTSGSTFYVYGLNAAYTSTPLTTRLPDRGFLYWYPSLQNTAEGVDCALRAADNTLCRAILGEASARIGRSLSQLARKYPPVTTTQADVAPPPPQATTSAAFTTCSLYQRNANVIVVLHASDASTACPEFVRTWTRSGLGTYNFWLWQHGDRSLESDPTSGQPYATELQRVCTATYKTGAFMTVDDSGGQFLGGQVCTALTAAVGWTVN
jgi:hypothetical protein